jgi:hypothetical protein
MLWMGLEEALAFGVDGSLARALRKAHTRLSRVGALQQRG